MDKIALGAVVFKRVDKTKELLQSINDDEFSKVYIADVGELTHEKQDIYNEDYSFELDVIDLDYNAGLGAGRNSIVQKLQNDFILFLDNDMTVPYNVQILHRQLLAQPDLGGVCGMMVVNDRIYTSCCDLFEKSGTLKKDIRKQKKVNITAGAPIVDFDFVTNAAVFRRECVEEYTWDPKLKIGREHIDFFVGQMKRTDWSFALSPSVIFNHNPGGPEEYLAYRHSKQQYKEAEQYFLNKWGYTSFEESHPSWVDTYNYELGGFPPHSLIKKARRYYHDGGAPVLINKALSYLKQQYM